MAFNNGLRSALQTPLPATTPFQIRSVPFPSSPPPSSSSSDLGFDLTNTFNRGIHSTGVKQMGGHGLDEPFYLHAKHMYNIHRMPHQKLKMSLAVAVAIIAVVLQQRKTASG